MARDFLTSQIRTNQIIASRSLGGYPSLMIISASSADGTGGATGIPTTDPNIFLFVSGSRNGNATTLFGGDVFSSGSLTVNDELVAIGDFFAYGNTRLGDNTADLHQVTGTLSVLDNALFKSGISGSIQRTVSGVSYLVAGTGISVASASNGQITISSMGTAGGINTQVQFNDAGILNGDDGLVYNKTTKTLTVGNLFITGSVTAITTSNLSISDAIIYLASGSTGPNVKSVIAFASGSQTSNQSLIFGSLGANDTIVAAKLDVQGGTISQASLAFTDLVPIRASKFEVGTGIALTSSDGASVTLYSGGGGALNLVPGSIGLKAGNILFPVAISGSNVRIGGASSAYGGEMPPMPGSDAYFFVSGNIASKPATSPVYTTAGTAVFGGDVVISGTLFGGSPLYIGSPVTASAGIAFSGSPATFSAGLSGSLTKLSDGTSYLIAGTNVSISTGSSGAITISSTGGGGGGGGSNFFLDTAGAGKIYTTASSVAFPFGESGITEAANKGTDVFFFVSGSSSGTATALFSGNIVTSGSIKIRGNITGDNTGARTIFSDVVDITIGGASSTINLAGDLKVTGNDIKDGNNDVIITLAGDGTKNATFAGDIAVNGSTSADITTSTTTATIFNLNATTVSAFGAATTLTLGATGASTANIRGGTLVGSETTQNVFNTTATTVNAFGAATSITLGATAGTTTLRNKLARSGNLSAGSWTTNGISADFVAGTFTDNSSAGGSTIASRSAVSVNTPTYASNNSITVTDAANLYISNAPSPGTNTTITNSYALWVDAGNSRFDGDVLPGADLGSSLGSPFKRWANIYTGDLHLRNDRGDWTIIEEEDYLTITNNISGKKYKFVMEEI